MKALAIVLTVLAVAAVVVTFALAYVAIFRHDGDLAAATYLTLWLDFGLGVGAAAAWANGGAS